MKHIKPVYWLITGLAVGAIIVKLVSGSESIESQIEQQEKIVKELTAKVEYASGDITKRKEEYDQLYKLNGGAMKVLEELKKAERLGSKVISTDLKKQFTFTGSIY